MITSINSFHTLNLSHATRQCSNNDGKRSIYRNLPASQPPAFAHRHDSRAALSEVKDIDDISTETIIIIITRHKNRQPASQPRPGPASPRACSCTPAAQTPAYLLLLRSIYHPHIQRRLTPSALSAYHAAGLQAEQESLPVHKRSVAGSCGKLGGSHQPARGAVGSLESQKRPKLSVRLSCFSRGRVSSSDGAPFCFGLQNAWRDHVKQCGIFKVSVSKAFLVESPRACNGRAVFVRWSAVSCRTRYVGGGCRTRDDISFYTIGFFGV